MAERNPQEKKASELLMENLDKTYESKLSGKRKAVEKWSNRGESGKAELAKELAALQELEKKQDRKSFDGSYIDMETLENMAVMRTKAVILGSRKL
jgi:predicted ATPase with chaperone activity